MIGVPPVVVRTEARHRASVCLCFLAPAGHQRVSLAAVADRNPPFFRAAAAAASITIRGRCVHFEGILGPNSGSKVRPEVSLGC